jgi:hypothetical protein
LEEDQIAVVYEVDYDIHHSATVYLDNPIFGIISKSDHMGVLPSPDQKLVLVLHDRDSTSVRFATIPNASTCDKVFFINYDQYNAYEFTNLVLEAKDCIFIDPSSSHSIDIWYDAYSKYSEYQVTFYQLPSNSYSEYPTKITDQCPQHFYTDSGVLHYIMFQTQPIYDGEKFVSFRFTYSTSYSLIYCNYF